MIAISLTSITLLLIPAAFAFYISVKNSLRWKESEMDTVRAKVFLDKSFLNANFKLTLVVVWSVFINFIMMEYAEFTGLPLQGFLNIIYFGFSLGSMVSLTLLMYIWYKLLRKK